MADAARGARPAEAVFQRYGATWLAMARSADGGLALVTPELVVALPLEPPAPSVAWRSRLVWAELRVAPLRFRYRRPAATLGTKDPHTGIDHDLAFWVHWRLRESLGLRDWAERPDWRTVDSGPHDRTPEVP